MLIMDWLSSTRTFLSVYICNIMIQLEEDICDWRIVSWEIFQCNSRKK